MIGSHVRAFRCRACGYCCYRNKLWESYLAVDEGTFEKITNDRIDDIQRNITTVQNVRQLKCTGNHCSFLNKHNLCEIHLKYGYEYLPDACKTYPRIIGLSPRGIEISLVFICREAIKTIISQNKIVFSEEKVSGLIHPNSYHYEIFSTDEYDLKRIEAYFAFLPKAINDLQNRCQPLKQRLLVLGEESLRLNEYADRTRYSSETSIANALRILHDIIISRTYEADNDYTEQYLENLRKVGAVITDDTFSLAKFRNIKERFIDREYAKYEYILENYAVNFMTTNMYFFNGSVFGYMMLMLLVASIMVFMSGYAAYYRRSMDEEIMIIAIQTVDTGFFGHFNWFASKITDIIKQHGTDNTAKIAASLGQVL